MSYVIKQISFDDGKTWQEPISTILSERLQEDCVRGGSCNSDSYINLRNYTPNLDRIARDIANRTERL